MEAFACAQRPSLQPHEYPWKKAIFEFDLRIVNTVSGTPGVTFHVVNERGGDSSETTVAVRSGGASPYLHLTPGHSYAISATAPGTGIAAPVPLPAAPLAAVGGMNKGIYPTPKLRIAMPTENAAWKCGIHSSLSRIGPSWAR